MYINYTMILISLLRSFKNYFTLRLIHVYICIYNMYIVCVCVYIYTHIYAFRNNLKIVYKIYM